MKLTTVGIIALCVVVFTYLYVMGLCYLCDLYEQKKLAKRDAEDKRRKEELQRAMEETEARRRTELQRRKKLAEERRERGPIKLEKPSHMPARS